MFDLKSLIKISSILFLFYFSLSNVYSQSLKEKMKAKMAKDNSEIYECGYVHKKTLAEKANPMAALQKAVGGAMGGSTSDLGTASISVFYQAHLHPQNILKYPTKTPNWETCGDAVFGNFTNREGIGFTYTDGSVTVDGTALEEAGMGTFFHGFKPSLRGDKKVKITSSNGNSVEVTVKPAAALEIKSIDGKLKGEELIIDGSKDIIVELENGNTDPNSKLHVQLICKLVGTPVIYDLIVTTAKNTISIPKEAFKNFEGSPAPISKNNTLVVNRVTEEIIDGTDAGAIRTLSAYMDWAPISIEGDIAKGSIMTSGFDESKNTAAAVDLTTTGEYNFKGNTGTPFTTTSIDKIGKVAFASFVVRGNLKADSSYSSSFSTATTTTTITTTITKKFVELPQENWQALADQMYNNVASQLEAEMKWNILPLEEVVNAKAYAHTRSVEDTVTQNFVEIGAGGTKRILSSNSDDYSKDMSISFVSDQISERLIKELDVDAVLAVTVDLNFNFTTRAIDPVVSIIAFAPNISYKTASQYFNMSASTESKSIEEAVDIANDLTDFMYQMIKFDTFNIEFLNAIKQLESEVEAEPIFKVIQDARN